MIAYAQFVLGHFSECFRLENGPNSLGLSMGYSAQDVLQFCQARTTDQLLCYVSFLRIWDAIFPLIYASMHATWILFLFNRWRFLLVVPAVHVFADWIENSIEMGLVQSFLDGNTLDPSDVALGSAVTVTKWALSVVTYGILLLGIVRRIRA